MRMRLIETMTRLWKRLGSGISLIEMAVVLGLLVGIAMVMLIMVVGRSERQEQIYEERQQQVLQASGLDMEEHARDRLSDLINDNLMSMDRDDLAEALGYEDFLGVARLENGEEPLTPDLREQIADVYDVSEDWFVEGLPEPGQGSR